MAKSKSRRKPADPVADIKNRIRGSNAPLTLLSRLRSSLTLVQLQSLIRWLPSLPWRGRPILSGPFPAQLSDIRRGPILQEASLDAEIKWYVATFAAYPAQINEFLHITRPYDSLLLTGRFLECLNILDALDYRLGKSLWAIEHRLALLQFYQGLEAQKAYLFSLLDDDLDPTVRYLVFRLSNRNEEVVTFEGFTNTSREHAAGVSEEFGRYLLFKTIGNLDGNPKAVAGLLRYEATSPLIDQYETFVHLAARFISIANHNSPKELGHITTLCEQIEDPRLKRIEFLRTGDASLLHSDKPRSLIADNALAVGDLVLADREGEKILLDHPEEMATRLVVAIAEAELGVRSATRTTTLGDRIQEKLGLLAAHEGAARAAATDLVKTGLNFRPSRFASALSGIVSSEWDSSPIHANPLSVLGAIQTSHIDPRIILYLQNEQTKVAVAQWCLSSLGPEPALIAILHQSNIPKLDHAQPETSLSQPIVLMHKIERAIRQTDYDLAINICETQSTAQTNRQRALLARFHAHCLLRQGRPEDAIDYVVTQVLKDENIVNMLPLEKCTSTLDSATRARLAGKLSTPILLDLYNQFCGSDRLRDRNYAYEDFLISHGISRPSSIAINADSFDRQELLYYLSKICKQSVMLVSTEFSGTRDLDEERMAICTLLTALDEANSEQYETEVREITRSISLQKAVRDVEQSKVFVDESQIRQWAEKEHKENYLRYRSLALASPRVGSAAVRDAALDLLAGSSPQSDLLEVPADEAGALLIQMVRAISKEALQNDRHGLDCYLSMRIRHGALSGQLRGPLEQERVITQRLTDKGPYQENEYWNSLLGDINIFDRQRIIFRLGQFSREFDMFIDEITNDLIQIRSEEKPKGMFNPRISFVQVRIVGEAALERESFEDFFGDCMKLFWQAIDYNLEEIRSQIDTSLKKRLNVMFERLETDLAVISGAQFLSLGQIDSAIRTAETRARAALDEAKQWFRLPKPLQDPPLAVDDLIDVGLACVRRLHQDFNPIVEKNTYDVPALIGALTAFSDIFFVIFSNIRRHSGIRPSPRVQITTQISGQLLHINVWNELSPNVRTAAIEERLKQIRESIHTGRFGDIVRSEGGSGFAKIWKIVSSGSSGELDFGFDESGGFSVSITMGVYTIPNAVAP